MHEESITAPRLNEQKIRLEERLKSFDADVRGMIMDFEKIRLSAKVALHDRMAVLSAGSIAAIVSAVGVWVNQHPASPTLSTLKLFVIAPLCGAWLALVSALLHNVLLNRSYDSKTLAFRSAFGVAIKFRSLLDEKKSDEEKNTKDSPSQEAEKMQEKMNLLLGHANYLEDAATKLGYASLACFSLTYLSIIVSLVYLL